MIEEDCYCLEDDECYTDLSPDEEMRDGLIQWGIWKFIRNLGEDE